LRDQCFTAKWDGLTRVDGLYLETAMVCEVLFAWLFREKKATETLVSVDVL
jgi:hypothetical protein